MPFRRRPRQTEAEKHRAARFGFPELRVDKSSGGVVMPVRGRGGAQNLVSHGPGKAARRRHQGAAAAANAAAEPLTPEQEAARLKRAERFGMDVSPSAVAPVAPAQASAAAMTVIPVVLTPEEEALRKKRADRFAVRQ